jgi:hypothetical protein
MPRYSVAFQAHRSGHIWVKSYRSLTKPKRAAAGVFKKTTNDPLLIFKNSVQRTDDKKATFKKSKGFNYGSWLGRFQKTKSRPYRAKGTNFYMQNRKQW